MHVEKQITKNMFSGLNEMLESVRSLDNGVRMGNDSFNILAYADDVTLFSSTLTS